MRSKPKLRIDGRQHQLDRRQSSYDARCVSDKFGSTLLIFRNECLARQVARVANVLAQRPSHEALASGGLVRVESHIWTFLAVRKTSSGTPEGKGPWQPKQDRVENRQLRLPARSTPTTVHKGGAS